jgi:RHS repeat-associated protein
MPGRSFTSSNSYKYGFIGKEKDDETGTLDFGARSYDPRLGKFLSIDPLYANYPQLTPYNYAGNSPIVLLDNDGKKITIYYTDDEGKQQTIVVSKVSDLETLKSSKNNFVRAVVENIIEINNSGDNVLVDLINSKDNVNLAFGVNQFLTPEEAEGVTGIKEETILFDPQIKSKSFTKEAFDILKLIEDKMKGLDGRKDEDAIAAIKGEMVDAAAKIKNLYTEESDPSEVLVHEVGHRNYYKKNPGLYEIKRVQKDKYFDNKEERRNETGKNSSEVKLRKYHGKGPRQTHSGTSTKTDLKIGKGGQNVP